MMRRVLGAAARRQAGGRRWCSEGGAAAATQSRILPCGSKATGVFEGGVLAEGTLLAADGSKRVGVFEGGKLAQGSVALPDGRVYTGQFAAGAPQAGTLTEDGNHYTGAFNAKWQRHGEGKEVCADGTVHEGTFADDWMVEGTVTIPETQGRPGAVFKGRLEQGVFKEGTLVFNGMSYTGQLDGSNPHGKGRLELPDGSVREGRFAQGVLAGEGLVVLKNGTVLSGEFDAGRLPEGSIKWTSGDFYEGELDEQHRPHGAGKLYKPAQGHWWAGEWVHGTFSGGSVTDDDGTPVDYRTSPPNTAL